MFFDEEMLLDLRLNIMNKYVDKFIITESTQMHSGKSKKLVFDINKFFCLSTMHIGRFCNNKFIYIFIHDI